MLASAPGSIGRAIRIVSQLVIARCHSLSQLLRGAFGVDAVAAAGIGGAATQLADEAEVDQLPEVSLQRAAVQVTHPVSDLPDPEIRLRRDGIEDCGLPRIEVVGLRDDIRADRNLAAGPDLGKLGRESVHEVFEPTGEVELHPNLLERGVEGVAVAVVELAQREEPAKVIPRAVEAQRGQQP